jgi:2-polyprenyl-3-methyl-5-hydroxy-6-metoxy-1,4-benzoquinol methylase
MNKKYKIFKNEKYDFFQITPTPSAEEITKFYNDEFYTGDFKKFNDSSLEVQLDDVDFYNENWENIYNNIKKYLNINTNTDQSILDVGCGWGLALEFFKKKGFDCYGFDPAPEAVEYVKKRNINIKLAGIEGMNVFKKNDFNVVTLFNVLEHLPDPEKTINQIHNILSDNSILIIDVPNEFNDFQLAGQKTNNLDEWWVCPPNHLNYFSYDSMKKLLELNNFDLVYAQSSFPLEMFLLFEDNYVGGEGKLGKACHNKRVNFEKNMRKFGKDEKLNKFYANLAKLNLGRQITFYAKKR